MKIINKEKIIQIIISNTGQIFALTNMGNIYAQEPIYQNIKYEGIEWRERRLAGFTSKWLKLESNLL